ncbi:nuclear intron maturase 1, mitochondrial-like [Papaver somniferum]|uniref:nuclear intron maturase 1, mitochondrial-like n=1 Tax=Papaver somniferum TaxID=3469 RepID=UPI000E6F9297|nr:nuclear intron maturase 1, mitochondrial-like [Papaver somniferum]
MIAEINMSLTKTIKHLPCTFIFRAITTISQNPNLRDQTHQQNEPPPRQQQQQQDPYSLMKEDPIQVCSELWFRTFSSQINKPFTNLTGFLKKFDLWVLAYQRSCAEETGSFPQRNAIHSNVLSSLLSLQNAVLHGHFVWGMKTHPFIRSPNDKPITRLFSRRKLLAMLQSDKPCFQDRIVQEVLLLILEPVFEPRFSSKSHAFRPGRNAHTVIRSIRSNFAGYLWFLKGDLSEIYEHVGKDVLMNCLEKGVKDKKVLSLIKSAVTTPIRTRTKLNKEVDRTRTRPKSNQEVERTNKEKKNKKKGTRRKILNEDEPKPDPYWLRTFFDFAPEEAIRVPWYGHCGILSPLLSNVCLHELDTWMEGKIVNFFCPSKFDSIWKDTIDDGSHNPAWPEFVPSSGKEKTRKMDFIRYGGHFLVGIRGPREDAVDLMKELIEFCETKYGLRLDSSEFEIEHITRGIQFLDHIICRRVIHPTLRYTSSGGKIVSQKKVGTLLSVTASLPQCIYQFRRLKFVKGDRDPQPLPCTAMLYSSQAHTNSQMNKFLETMADWYRYADNRKKVVGFCSYVIRSSLAKLYAARYRLKSRAKVYKIATRDLSRPLRENHNNGASESSDLFRMGLVDAISGIQFSHMSLIPSCDYTPFPKNWVPGHERVLHEYTRLQDPKFFCKLHRSVKQEGLDLPQEEISKIVWDFKTCGARGGGSC